MIRLDISGFSTQNQYINAERTNRYIAAKIKKDCTNLVAWQVKKENKITKPVAIHFVWEWENMRPDPDNIAFMKKFVLDGLVKGGVLENDTFKYVKGFSDGFKKGGKFVEIEFEEE